MKSVKAFQSVTTAHVAIRFAATILLFTIHSSLFTPAARAQASPADQEFLFAYKLMQRGDLAEAGGAFDAFLEKFPQDSQRGDALYFRAALYRQAGALEAAAELLAGAQSSVPKRVPAYAVQLLRGQVLTDLGKYDAALESLERVDLGALPDQAEASVLLLRSLAYRGAGNYEAATKAAAAAAAHDSPVKARAMLELARSQALGGRHDAALETLDDALALDNKAVNPEAARLAGDLAFEAEQFDRAVTYYTRVIERDQTSGEFGPAVVGRMWADLRAGRNVAVVNAHKQFADALPADAKTTAAYVTASAYQALDQHAPAAELFTTYTAGPDTQPMQAAALYKLAVSQFELTRYRDMEATVERLEKAFPDSPRRLDASFLLASAEAKQGNAAAGVARLKPFIDAGPSHPYHAQSLLQRAALYEQSGELDAAAADLKRYLDQSDAPPASSAKVALRYADLSHRLDRFDEAIAVSRALAEADTDPAVTQEALYRLGEAQTRAGEFDQALATFDKLQREHPLNDYRQAVDLRRGLLLNKLGRADESMKVLIAAADDERLPTRQRVAALRIIAAQLRDAGRADDAALSLRRMEQIGGVASLADHELLWLADHEVQRGEPRAALALLDVFNPASRRLTGGPEAEALYIRGRAHFALDELDHAYRAFFGVVALGRGYDLEARLYLARTQMRRGELDEALIELSDLTKAEDSRIVAEALYEAGRAHRQRAELMRRRGDTQAQAASLGEARNSIKRMVLLYLTVEEIRPLQERGLIELAEIAEALGERDTMARELEELIRTFPDSAYADYAKAVLAQKQRNRPDDALALLSRLDRAALDPVLRAKVSEKVSELEAMR